MISGFLKKLLLSREASMMEGEITLLGNSFYMQPLSELIFLHYDMKGKFGVDGTTLLYGAGKKSSQDFFRKMEKFTVRKEDKIKLFFNMLNLYGFGEMQIVNIVDGKKAVIEVGNNNFAKNYMKQYGRQEVPVDNLLAGLLAGFFEELWKKSATCQETNCVASAKMRCQFRIEG